MTDIVERLRALSIDYSVQEGGFTGDGVILAEAADEIERLRASSTDEILALRQEIREQKAEIDRLRADLKRAQADRMIDNSNTAKQIVDLEDEIERLRTSLAKMTT